jgi:hypothetical protein
MLSNLEMNTTIKKRLKKIIKGSITSGVIEGHMRLFFGSEMVS